VKRSIVLAIVLTFASVSVVMFAAIAAVWLTDEVRVVGLVMLPTVVVASLLVLYFDWRERLQRRMLAERGGRTEWGEAA
jgi:hypothetical protein